MKLTVLFLIVLIFCTSNCFAQSDYQDLLDQINSYRRKRLPLVYDDKYQAECDGWAKKLSKDFGHSFYHWHHLTECVSRNAPEKRLYLIL
jgi:hypothetical protein